MQIDSILACLRGHTFDGPPEWAALQPFLNDEMVAPKGWSFRQFLFTLDYLARLAEDPLGSAGFVSRASQSHRHAWIAGASRDSIWAYSQLFTAIRCMQMSIFETRNIHRAAKTSPGIGRQDVSNHAFSAEVASLLDVLEGTASTEHKFSILQAFTEALTDIVAFSTVNLLLRGADDIEPSQAMQAVIEIAFVLVSTWTTCPRLTVIAQEKLKRLIRLAEADRPVPGGSSGRYVVFEPSRVVYVQTAKVLCLYLSAGPRYSPDLNKQYSRELIRLKDMLFTPGHSPSLLDFEFVRDFRPGEFGAGWPSSITDLQKILHCLSKSNTIHVMPESSPTTGGAYVLLKSLDGLPPNGASSMYIQIPGDDMAPFLLGVEGVEYRKRYLQEPLAVWAQDPKVFVASPYGRLANALPTSLPAHHNSTLVGEIHDISISTIVGSIVSAVLPGTVPGGVARILSAIMGRVVGRATWSYFTGTGEPHSTGDDWTSSFKP